MNLKYIQLFHKNVGNNEYVKITVFIINIKIILTVIKLFSNFWEILSLTFITIFQIYHLSTLNEPIFMEMINYIPIIYGYII